MGVSALRNWRRCMNVPTTTTAQMDWYVSPLGHVETQVIWQCFSNSLVRTTLNVGRREVTSAVTTSQSSTEKLSTRLEGDVASTQTTSSRRTTATTSLTTSLLSLRSTATA